MLPPGPPAPLPGGGSSPGRLQRVFTALASSIGLSALFAGALVSGFVLHMNAPPTRRTIQAAANLILGSLFQGRIIVGEIDRLNLHGITIRWARAVDAAGGHVARIDHLVADCDLVGLGKDSLFGSGDRHITLPLIHIDSADALIERGDNRVPTIAEAFLPRVVAPPGPPGARPLRLALERIEIGHVWAHGMVAPPTLLDAEVNHLATSITVGPEGVAIDLEPTELVGRSPLPQKMVGTATFHLRVDDHAPVMVTGFGGDIGGVTFQLDAKLDGDHLSGIVDVPRVTPEQLSSLIPVAPGKERVKLPLRVPVSANIEIDGDVPSFAIDARVGFEDHGFIGLDGRLALQGPPRIEATVEVGDVDLNAVLDLPGATKATALGQVSVEIGKPLRLEALVSTRPLTLGGNVIPALDAHAVFDGEIWNARASIHELGIPTVGSFVFDPKKGLAFDVTSDVASLGAVPRLRGAPVAGAARVRVSGTLLGTTLDARIAGRFSGVRAAGSVALESGGIQGHVTGKLPELEVDASVSGQGLRAGGYAWDKVTLHARGPVLRPQIEAVLDAGGGESVHARGSVDAKAGAARDVDVVLKRATGEVGMRVARVAATPGGVAIEGIRLEGEGVGELRGGLVIRNKELVGKLHGENVDLAKVAALAGVHQGIAGLANVDVELGPAAHGRTGRVALELVNGGFGGVEGVSGQFVASFEGDRMKTDGLLRLVAHASEREKKRRREERCDGTIIQLRIAGGEAELRGPLLDPATWKGLSGKVELAADDLHLRCITRLAPEALVAGLLSEVQGKLSTRIAIERPRGSRYPSVRQFVFQTRGLELAGPLALDKTKPKGKPLPEWESKDLDVIVKGSLDTDDGKTTASVALSDGRTVAEVSGEATLDLMTLLAHPERRFASLRKSPIALHLSVPRHALDGFGTMPSFVRTKIPALGGEIEVLASVKGTLERPDAELKVSAWNLADTAGPNAKEASPWELPLDLATTVKYDGHRATLEAKAHYQAAEVLDARAALTFELQKLLDGDVPQLGGDFHAKLTELPLGEVPFLADRDVAGHLGGSVDLEGIGQKPRLVVDLALPDLKIGQEAAFERGSIKLDVGRPSGFTGAADRGRATASVAFAAKDGGKLEVQAQTGIKWSAGLVPTLDSAQPAELTTTASRFRLDAAGPFVAGVLSRIDGYLDGKARLAWKVFEVQHDAAVEGTLALTKGVFNVPQIGQEFSNASLTIAGSPDGTILLKDLKASGSRGKLTGEAKAHFQGLVFRKAEASFSIKQGEEIPVTLEGVALGDARGEVRMTAETSPGVLDLKIKVPSLHVDLPAGSARSVQSLDANPDITIVNQAKQVIEARPPDATTLKLEVELGQIDLKNNMIDAGLTSVKGKPIRVVLTDKVLVSGDIQVTRGRVEVMHKQFDVEQGLVHLRPEEPGNPYVNVTARWDSPDGDPIYIDYVGLLLPIATSKLNFRSPRLSSDQVIATLLFGGEQQQTLGSSGAGGVPGQSLAGQILAQQLSTQLSSNLATSFGTNDDGSLRPGLTYTAGNKIIALSTYEGTSTSIPGSGSGPSSASATAGGAATKSQHTMITIDWRFWKNWSLRGLVDVSGDQTTTGLDVLWQYRY